MHLSQLTGAPPFPRRDGRCPVRDSPLHPTATGPDGAGPSEGLDCSFGLVGGRRTGGLMRANPHRGPKAVVSLNR